MECPRCRRVGVIQLTQATFMMIQKLEMIQKQLCSTFVVFIILSHSEANSNSAIGPPGMYSTHLSRQLQQIYLHLIHKINISTYLIVRSNVTNIENSYALYLTLQVRSRAFFVVLDFREDLFRQVRPTSSSR